MGKEYEGIHRITFIIDGNGIVERIIDKVKTKEHASQILEWELKFLIWRLYYNLNLIKCNFFLRLDPKHLIFLYKWCNPFW